MQAQTRGADGVAGEDSAESQPVRGGHLGCGLVALVVGARTSQPATMSRAPSRAASDVTGDAARTQSASMACPKAFMALAVSAGDRLRGDQRRVGDHEARPHGPSAAPVGQGAVDGASSRRRRASSAARRSGRRVPRRAPCRRRRRGRRRAATSAGGASAPQGWQSSAPRRPPAPDRMARTRRLRRRRPAAGSAAAARAVVSRTNGARRSAAKQLERLVRLVPRPNRTSRSPSRQAKERPAQLSAASCHVGRRPAFAAPVHLTRPGAAARCARQPAGELANEDRVDACGSSGSRGTSRRSPRP